MTAITIRPALTMARVRLSESLGRWWLAWLLTGVLAALILFPLLMIFYASLTGVDFGDPTTGLTLDSYAKAFSSPETYHLIWTTVWLAAVRVALASVIGIFLAWVVTRTDTPFRGAIEVMMWIKFFAPPLPMVVAWTILGSKNGILNQIVQMLPFVEGPLFNIYSYEGIIWVSTLSLAAFIFLITVPAFRAMDATLEESATVAGASRMQVLRYVTVPVLLPTVLGAVFLAFIIILESFETEVLLGIPSKIYVLTTQIFLHAQEYPRDLPQATALSSFFLLVVGVLIILQMKLLHGRSFTTISGRGYSARPTPLGRLRWITFAICLLYFFIAMVLPLVTLVLGSFMKTWGLWDTAHITLDHWTSSLSDPRLLAAIGNTIVLGVVVGVGGTALCALAGYLLVRSRFPGRPLLEFVTWAPRVAPGVVLAIAFLWAYVGTFTIFRPLAGTIWIMAIVLIVNGLPVGSRILNGAMYQVSQELEEAGRVSGAGWLTTFRRLLLPMLAPALMTSFVLLFLAAIRNLVLVVFFYSPNSRVLSAIFWESWRGNFPERALVAGLLMMAISGVALVAALMLRRRAEFATLR